MKTAATIFAICLVLFVDGGALASESTAQVIKRQAPKGITGAFYECIEEAESDNVALAACQSIEKKGQDTRLNAAYKLLLSKQRDTSKDNLVRAERAWLALHDTSKAFESSLLWRRNREQFSSDAERNFPSLRTRQHVRRISVYRRRSVAN